ncbi:IS4 family transposase (plasmid) [Streptomyces sp. NBC_00257]|uniref:IS4 family transposase n=1 Tax=unclassified Streptomyces TaxID=2593676 RepID=UPI00224E3511|nr:MULTISPECIES: IS4 family transposase [unclassified Streptomyces]MCX5434555.1 IS4 family transposase [Streptomyces sp. NBC_00062]
MPVHSVSPPALSAITRTVTVAAGRFAPGHLGALTPVVPFELVDAVLSESRAVQRRLRDLPSRVGVYFLLAMCLFPEVGYRLVWGSLSGMPVVCPSTKALRDLRRRLGSAPVQALFEVLAEPLARPTTPGVRFGPYRTVSFDGCSSIKVPNSERNRDWLGRCPRGGYPQVELMTLVETGTRAVIAAVFGPTREGETSYATRLLHHLGPDMLVLWDRGFDGNDFLAAVHATGARVLGRINQRRRPPVLKPLADSSYLSVIGGVAVRVIEARVSVTCTDGSTFEGSYRLATTLLDARHHPADRLVRLYHERWEHESAYYALRHTILHGRVLRSHDPSGVEQEMWALLTLYQLLRRTMVEAAESQPGTDPDRCGFTIALQIARDLLVCAEGIFDQGIGAIGRRVLSALLPARRSRVSTRKVKSPISRYAERKLDGRPDSSRVVTSTTITLLLPPTPQPELPTTTVPQYAGPERTSSRQARVLAILQAEPERLWRAREIAELLGDVTLVATYRQLARWTEKGMIKRVRTGRYTAVAQDNRSLA